MRKFPVGEYVAVRLPADEGGTVHAQVVRHGRDTAGIYTEVRLTESGEKTRVHRDLIHDIPSDMAPDFPFAPGPFWDGFEARSVGCPISDAPKDVGAFARQSWVAGWCDSDAGIAAGRDVAAERAGAHPCGCVCGDPALLAEWGTPASFREAK